MTMDVYIKRRDVLSLAKKGYLVGNGNYQSVKNYINSIPTANVLERKNGKWIWDDEGYHCSECFYHAYGNTAEIYSGQYNYCPSCGSRNGD